MYVPQGYHVGWSPAYAMPGAEDAPGWNQPPPQMGSDAWPEADSDAWDQPPPVQPQRNQELEALNTRFGQLQVQTCEIQNTLNMFVQTTT